MMKKEDSPSISVFQSSVPSNMTSNLTTLQNPNPGEDPTTSQHLISETREEEISGAGRMSANVVRGGDVRSRDKTQTPDTMKSIDDDAFHSRELVINEPSFVQTRMSSSWVHKFMPDPLIQQTYIATNIIRNVLVIQSIYYIQLYKSCFENKMQSLTAGKSKEGWNKGKESVKVGIIGCGQIGSMILLKMLQEEGILIPKKQVKVSTRQPQLLEDITQRFGVTLSFNNEAVASACDLILICVLPSQLEGVASELRKIINLRNYEADISPEKALYSKPLIVAIQAGVSLKRMHMLFSGETPILKTKINIPKVNQHLIEVRSNPQLQRVNTAISSKFKLLASSISEIFKGIPNKEQTNLQSRAKLGGTQEERVASAAESNRGEDEAPSSREIEESFMEYMLKESMDGLSATILDVIHLMFTIHQSIYPKNIIHMDLTDPDTPINLSLFDPYIRDKIFGELPEEYLIFNRGDLETERLLLSAFRQQILIQLTPIFYQYK